MFKPVIGMVRAPMSRVETYMFKAVRPSGEEIWLRGQTVRTRNTQIWCGWDWVDIDDWNSRPAYYRCQARRRGLLR